MPESTTVPAARAHVRETLHDWDLPFDRVEDAVLIASELVTNAVVHAGTDIELTCLLDMPGDTVRVEVRDLLPMRRVDAPDQAAGRLDGHRGLVLTHSLAEAWGVTYTKTSKTVWFELAGTARTHNQTHNQTHNEAHNQTSDPPPSLPAPSFPGLPLPGLPLMPVEQPVQPVPPPRAPVPYMTTSAIPPSATPSGPFSPGGVEISPGNGKPGGPATGLPAEQLFDHVVQWARASTGADAAYVLVGADDESLKVRASSFDDLAGAACHAADGPADPPAPRAELRPAEAARLAIAAHDDAAVMPPPTGSTFQSLATAPLRVSGQRLGLVVVTAEEPDRFGPADISRLQYAAESLAPVLSRERQVTGQHGYRGWLGFLAEANDLLTGTLDEKLVLALAAQLFVPRIASWCAVYLDDPSGKGVLTHVWHADEQLIGPLRELLTAYPAPSSHQVREARQWSTFASLAPSARRISGSDVLELPLACREHRFGCIVLGGPGDDGFRPELVRLAEDLAVRFALALLNARRYGEQVAVSQTLQRSLLPAHLPQIPGIDYSIVYLPAGQDAKAGGDFYDLFPAGRDRWRFMLGDVCGTGAAAAAVTGLVRHTLRALSREGRGTARALDSLNEAMLDDDASRLLTIVHGELERLSTGNLRISVTSAGHPLPLRLRPDGEVTAIGTSQLLVGAVTEPAYRLDTMELAPGDVMLCVTDGITERRRGDAQLDDDNGLARLLSDCTGLTARAVTLRIQAAVREFTSSPLDDDMAIFAMRVE
ncbi:SpoIIE family protein phosphatase [Actinomadura rudentiformis]|uniref:SpoIIE family protein phosphatase n=1 Tax=Actinomadura rudentiformis TaxID=359158 RepID=A0A6H9YUW8_9ACTN|nr:SpoIIE family protein phosphatase [Actinomadura rudentiformis]KAB2345230.1 SpoIIE family protein phosphatase [Actinomadura rudentiformis]